MSWGSWLSVTSKGIRIPEIKWEKGEISSLIKIPGINCGEKKRGNRLENLETEKSNNVANNNADKIKRGGDPFLHF